MTNSTGARARRAERRRQQRQKRKRTKHEGTPGPGEVKHSGFAWQMCGPDAGGVFRVTKLPLEMSCTWPREVALEVLVTTRRDISRDVAADVLTGIAQMLQADAARDAETVEREVAAHGGGGFGGRARGDA